jgi:antirestriction protein ArdC
LTYKQAIDLGANVRKGERGIPIVYWGKVEREKPSGEQDGFFFAKYYTVFNVEQCDNLKLSESLLYPDKAISVFGPIEACEAVVSGMPQCPRIQHAEPKAYYSPTLDYVNMPNREIFETAEGYYSTLFHELGHSTGHETRLNRKTLTDYNAAFGSSTYSKEELVAEMTAAFLCSKAGIDQPVINNSASYIAAWLKMLRGDSKLVITAASAAQKAADFILNTK